MHLSHLPVFCRQLAALLRSGLPLVQALEHLARAFPREHYRRVAISTAQGLAQGHGFAAQLAGHPRLFPSLAVSVLQAGEENDNLPSALDIVSLHYQQRQQLRRELAKALFYPFLVLTLAVAAGIFVLWWVVPAFSLLYASLGTAMPPATSVIIAFSRWLTPFRLLAALALPLVVLLAARRWLKLATWRRRARIPLLGNVDCYNFCRLASLVLQGGHTLERALKLTARIFPRGPAPVLLREMLRGNDLSMAEEGGGELQSFLAQGEALGNMGQALEAAADYYRTRVEDQLSTVHKVAEPAAVLVVGGMVAVLLLSLMLPLFQLAVLF